VLDPYGVLGLPPGAPPDEVRAARRALARALHPDLRSTDDPAVRAAAERRLAEVNAAYDALAERDPPPEPSAAVLTIAAFRPVAFEALVVAAADVGDVTDADEPFSLDVHVDGPPAGFCHLELFPEAGGTVVMIDSEAVDPLEIGASLVEALVRLGVDAVTGGSAR
jgi:hypothetical protein